MVTYPIIVLEGPDGCGKTTLANELVKLLGAHYSHLTYRFKNKMDVYHTAGLFNVLHHARTKPVILDRWWGSELVYADAYRGGSRWPLLYRMFEKVALKHCFVYVFCLPYDKHGYLEHYNRLKSTRVEMYDSGMERVYDGYATLFRKLQDRPGVYRYDYNSWPLDTLRGFAQLISEAVFDLMTEQWKPALNPNLMNFTGLVSTASHVLVGDELKPKTRREVWPFFEYANSSLWLSEVLEDLGVKEQELIFINANHTTDGADIFIKEYGNQFKYVAMGLKAVAYLKSQGIDDFNRTHHPQYYRRFATSQGYQDFREIFNARNRSVA